MEEIGYKNVSFGMRNALLLLSGRLTPPPNHSLAVAPPAETRAHRSQLVIEAVHAGCDQIARGRVKLDDRNLGIAKAKDERVALVSGKTRLSEIDTETEYEVCRLRVPFDCE